MDKISNHLKSSKVGRQNYRDVTTNLIPDLIYQKFIMPFMNDVLQTIKKDRMVSKAKLISPKNTYGVFQTYIHYVYTLKDSNVIEFVETYIVQINYDPSTTYSVHLLDHSSKQPVIKNVSKRSDMVATSILELSAEKYLKLFKK